MHGLRARIALTAVAASAAALLAVPFLVGPGLRERALDQSRQTLLAEARLMARIVEQPLAEGRPPAELDALVDAAAGELRARVTVIAPDGRVVADSALSGEALRAVESHARRPEVREALASGVGLSQRHSSTVGDDMLYAAVAVPHAGRRVGVVRVALSLDFIARQASELRRALGLALALAFAVTALLSAWLSSPMAGPLTRIMQAAREFGSGRSFVRIQVDRDDELGELARILNQSAEQLDERLAENARERARTEAILAAMEEGLLAVDHRGVVLVANERLRRSLGLEDPRGRHYVEVVRQPELAELLQAVLEGGERREREVDLPHVRRAFSVTGVPFPGPEGVPHGAVLTFHDVTARRALERVRRDFVANASHELRTPLTSIRGFVEALEDGGFSEPDTATRFLGKIRVHADRMAALVEDLLELSRLEAGERPARFEPLLPADVAADALASFARAAEQRGIRLEQRDEGAPAVETDPDRLLRILGNLVDNALKYTPSGGRVQVVTGPGPQGGAVLRVIDDGPGIAPEHLPRIFERFYRVDAARSRELGGTGLGLSIVRHLSESIAANVTVESRVGAGSTFSVNLPARR